MELDFAPEGFEGIRAVSHTEIHHEDLKAVNTAESSPVVPCLRELGDKLLLKPYSWNMIKFTY
ncbi:MAG: hypothetical protein II350_08575 [Clostridia bacterium]|nr:hypothetical protein [Clostridia bacterium]